MKPTCTLYRGNYCLEVELRALGIPYEREYEMDIVYKKEWPIGQRRVDFLIDGRVMLEIKAIRKMENIDKVQISNYCKIYGLPYGLLINFGGLSLEFHRIYNLFHPDNAAFRSKPGQGRVA